MLTKNALKQGVRSALRQIYNKTRDLPNDRAPSYRIARERLAGYGEVMDFGMDAELSTRQKELIRVEFQHDGYKITINTGKRYNVISEVGRRGPRRPCFCGVTYRVADNIFLAELKSSPKCPKEHKSMLFDNIKAEDDINAILEKYAGVDTSLYLSSGRYGWKSGICTGDVEDLQLGISPRKQTKIWELELRELLAAQRKLIGHLRTAER
jgi:hypothetical protein